MTLQLTECYAILINCFWNYDNWIAANTTIFPACALSKNADIAMYEYKNLLLPFYIFGDKVTVTVNNLNCYPGKN